MSAKPWFLDSTRELRLRSYIALSIVEVDWHEYGNEALAVAHNRVKRTTAFKDALAVCKRVRLLGCALGLRGGVAQREADRPLADLAHLLAHLLAKGLGNRAHTDEGGGLDLVDGRQEVRARGGVVDDARTGSEEQEDLLRDVLARKRHSGQQATEDDRGRALDVVVERAMCVLVFASRLKVVELPKSSNCSTLSPYLALAAFMD
ncbi:hypothetical protein ON010_g18686 [Phytophthora cinnamomi]|nr:hypothetical protein ON010_g18686 [Phytophthora cinnamomi]